MLQFQYKSVIRGVTFSMLFAVVLIMATTGHLWAVDAQDSGEICCEPCGDLRCKIMYDENLANMPDVPTCEDNDKITGPFFGNPTNTCSTYEITLTWGWGAGTSGGDPDYKRIYERLKTGGETGGYAYKSDQDDPDNLIAAKTLTLTEDESGKKTWTLKNAGYTIEQKEVTEESVDLYKVTIKNSDGVIIETATYDENCAFATMERDGIFSDQTVVGDLVTITQTNSAEVTVQKTYSRTTESVRKRVTVETYNSDGTTKRFLTTIYVYYGSSVTPVENQNKLWFIVDPEGVKRYLVNNHLADGISPSSPGSECNLDLVGTVSNETLDDYASVIYHLYDDSGRVTRVEGGGSCCGGGGGGSVKYVLEYGINGSHTAGDANSWKTYHRKAVAEVQEPSGDWVATAADPRTVEFLNEYGGVVYEVKLEVSSNSVVNRWITHHKYETQPFTAVDSDTCTTNGHGLYTGQLIWVSTSASDLPLGLTAGKMYWARSTGDNTFTLHTSEDGAKAVGDDVDKVDIEDAGTGTHSLQYNRISEVRSPSACASAGNVYGITTDGGWVTAVTPNSAGGTGLVRVYEYYNADDAGNGEYKGQLECEKVRKGTGSGNDEHMVGRYTYKLTDYNGSKVYHIATDTVYPGYVTSDTDGYTTTYTYTFYQDGGDTHAIEFKKVQYPVVGTDLNGPGGASTEVIYHYKQVEDGDDNVILSYNDWTKHEDGSLSFTKLSDDGNVEVSIVDVETNGSGYCDSNGIDGIGDDGGETHPPDEQSPVYGGSQWLNIDGLDLDTRYEYDDSGRTETVTYPDGRKTEYCYMCQSSTYTGKETTTSLVTLVAPHISGNNYSYLPVQITVTDLAGRTIHSAAGTPDDGATDGVLYDDWTKDTKTLTYGFKVNSSAVLTARTDSEYDLNGQLLRTRRYHTMPSSHITSDSGTLGTNYYRTVYQYDDLGRQEYTIQVTSGTTTTTSVEQVTKQVYDGLGRVKEVHRKVSDASHDMTSDYNNYPTPLTKISETFYDESTPGNDTSGVGDGNVTQTRAYYGSENYYETLYLYDYRSRLEQSRGPDNVATKRTLDNMGRATKVETYADSDTDWTIDGGASYELRAQSETKYDQKGQVYQSLVYKVTSDTPTVKLTTNYWYDAAGRTIKVKDPAGMFSKTQYDGAGRAVASFACYDIGEPAQQSTTHTEADDTDGDTIIRATVNVYDNAGRVTETKIGTTAANAVAVQKTWYDSNWDTAGGDYRPYATGVSTLKANVTNDPPVVGDYILTKYEYDYDPDNVPDGHRQYVTIMPDPDGAGDLKNTKIEQTYDALGRTTYTKTYKKDGETEMLLSQSGSIYGNSVNLTASRVYEVTSAGNLTDDYLETTYEDYYNNDGRLQKTTQPSGSFTKTKYNKYGRVEGTYLCTAEGATGDITDDTVVEQTVPSYDDVGRVWLTTSAQRNHDGSGTGALTTSNARVTYAVTWFDDLGRTSSVVNYGTNGTEGAIDHKDNSDFNSGETGDPDYDDGAPAPGTSDDEYVVTKYEYDGYGRNYQVTDNAGHKTRTFWDSSGRNKYIVENYLSGSDYWTNSPHEGPDDGIESRNADVNRITKVEYHGPTNLLVKQTAVDPDHNGTTTDNQSTRYVFAIDLDPTTYASWQPVKNGARLLAVIYPDSDDTISDADPYEGSLQDNGEYDRVELAYYADGSTYKRKDQRGVEHIYTYDDLGRQTKDDVTANLPAGVDDYITWIVRTYDDLGRTQKVTSWGVVDETDTCRNAVEYTYNDMGLPEKEYQEHEGDKDGNTLYVRYNYDDTVSENVYTKGMRPKSFRYPCYSDNNYTRTAGAVVARLVYSTYGSADSIADRLSRIDSIKDDPDGNGTPDATPLSAYSYNGAGTIVIEDYQQSAVKLDYFGGSSGTYAGFDRFGRVVFQIWLDYTPEPGSERVGHGYTYDAASNRTSRDNGLTTGKDEKYTYDGLNRLKSYDRGTLSGGNITNKVRNEAWTLSQTGNWDAYKINTNPGEDSDYTDATDLDQEREHNDVNEITDITEQSNPQQSQWANPVHDDAGNMTTVPKPTAMTATYACTYDAWNRLVEVKSGATTVGKYEYDGLNRRIKKHIDTQAPANPDGVDTYRHFYYNAAWQIVETRSTTSAENTEPETLQPEYQYVWSLRYIDAPILRDKNNLAEEPSPDDLCDDERLYYLNDANMNVTALVNTSGTVVERYVYDAYGKVTFLDGSWGSRQSSSYDNEILFCGYRHDPETGLYHVRYRPYHCTLGRWLVQDFEGYLESMSLLEYCISSPINRVDWLGLVSSMRALRPSDKTEEEYTFDLYKDLSINEIDKMLNRKGLDKSLVDILGKVKSTIPGQAYVKIVSTEKSGRIHKDSYQARKKYKNGQTRYNYWHTKLMSGEGLSKWESAQLGASCHRKMSGVEIVIGGGVAKKEDDAIYYKAGNEPQFNLGRSGTMNATIYMRKSNVIWVPKSMSIQNALKKGKISGKTKPGHCLAVKVFEFAVDATPASNVDWDHGIRLGKMRISTKTGKMTAILDLPFLPISPYIKGTYDPFKNMEKWKKIQPKDTSIDYVVTVGVGADGQQFIAAGPFQYRDRYWWSKKQAFDQFFNISHRSTTVTTQWGQWFGTRKIEKDNWRWVQRK